MIDADAVIACAAMPQVMQQHRAAEAIKDVERRLETAEKSRKERLQVRRALCWRGVV